MNDVARFAMNELSRLVHCGYIEPERLLERLEEGGMIRDVMTVADVADALAVSVETVRRLLRAKKLTAAKIGRDYRITRADLHAFLRASGSEGLVESGGAANDDQ